MKYLLAVLCCGLLLVAVSRPVGAISCHCFQDRSFDPTRPGASDAYFLATAQNSLMAAALDVPRRTIVKAKMSGIDADLLWIVYYVVDRAGLDAADLLELWSGSGPERFLSRLDELSVEFDRSFLMTLTPEADIGDVSDGAFESVMLAQLGVQKDVFERLEMSGASRRERCLAILISQLLAEDPTEIYQSVQSGRQSWSEALTSTGLAPDRIEATWNKLIEIERKRL